MSIAVEGNKTREVIAILLGERPGALEPLLAEPRALPESSAG